MKYNVLLGTDTSRDAADVTAPLPTFALRMDYTISPK